MDKDVIIVTGSCGRIGASVVKRLGDKYRIVGFELLKALYATANEELVPVDISSDESVQQAMNHIRYFYGERIASVVHLAAYYSFSDQAYEKYEAITVRGTQRLLKALQSFKVEQFIFSSTMLVHAPCEPNQKIDENWPLLPKWAYPLSKVRTEEIIHKERGQIPTVILRIAGVYDDSCHSIPISNQIQRIYENQLESRLFPGNLAHGASYLHMDDLVDAICSSIEKRQTLPKEITVLIGEPRTLDYDFLQRRISLLLHHREMKTYRIPKFVAKIGAWIQGHLPFIEKSFIQPWMIDIADDHYTLDVSLAKKILGWEPKRNLEESLPKMIQALQKDPEAWYKRNGLHFKK
ncbi:MAG: NAD-dependent epimerase/dehydratase family protein [Anaerolineae bacterium]